MRDYRLHSELAVIDPRIALPVDPVALADLRHLPVLARRVVATVILDPVVSHPPPVAPADRHRMVVPRIVVVPPEAVVHLPVHHFADYPAERPVAAHPVLERPAVHSQRLHGLIAVLDSQHPVNSVLFRSVPDFVVLRIGLPVQPDSEPPALLVVDFLEIAPVLLRVLLQFRVCFA